LCTFNYSSNNIIKSNIKLLKCLKETSSLFDSQSHAADWVEEEGEGEEEDRLSSVNPWIGGQEALVLQLGGEP